MNPEYPQTLWYTRGLLSPCFNDEECYESTPCGERGVMYTGQTQPQHVIGFMKEEEAFLASELKNLSFQERNKALEDVHCVGEGESEDPEMIHQALIDFQNEIERQADPTYLRALSRSRDYVEDHAFRLMFLRSKLYDGKQAARQMVNFLRNQETYFGAHTLGRDIAVTDLEEEDKQILASGIFHIQTERDKAGRMVIYLFNDMFLRKYKIESMIRAGCFMFFNCVRSRPDVQRQGVTAIFYDVVRDGGHRKSQSWDAVLELMNRALTLPLRYSSMHYCMKTNGESFSLNKVFLQVMLNGFPKYTTARTKFHYGGSDIELQYMLQGHGVPLGTFPVDSFGKIRQDQIDAWYNDNCRTANTSSPTERMSRPPVNDDIMQPERMESCSDTRMMMMMMPKSNDVLLGRGKRIQKHPGNIRFRDWMQEHRSEYDNCYKFHRRRVAFELKNRYAENIGGRFLKQTSDLKSWILASDNETEEKIKQLFRSFRRDA